MSAVLLTRLKITDLTALTALEAGRRMLPQAHVLERVVREELYLFEPEGAAGASSFEPRLLDAIESSNFFVNPNKERYRFLPAAERGERWAAPDGAWGIVARSRDDTRDQGLRARLEREHPLPGLGGIRRARVWWLWSRDPQNHASPAAFYAMLGPLVGPTRGLLVNPHAEQSLLVERDVAWRDVDRFLAEPAEAPAATSSS